MTKPADVIIANQTSTSARTDINNVNVSLVSNFTRSWSGTAVEVETTEPTQTYSNMWWYDTNNNLLKIRSEGNDAWISVAYLDQTNDKFRILDDTQVVDTSGTQTGLLGDQLESTWTTGTGITESLVSPAKVAASATEVVGNFALGVGQTWQDMTISRALNTTYQNTTGRPIFIALSGTISNGRTMSLLVSPNSDMSSPVTVDRTSDIDDPSGVQAIIPNNIYYQASVSASVSGLIWAELR
jgi:hypothetical protein